jgi:hypothetical protein
MKQQLPCPTVTGGTLDEEVKLLRSRLSKLEQAQVGTYDGDGQQDVQERTRKEVMDKRVAFLADRQPGTGGKLANPPTTSKMVTFGNGGDKSDGGTGTK